LEVGGWGVGAWGPGGWGLGLALVVALCHPASAQTAIELRQQSIALLNEENFAQAIPLIERLLAADANDPEANFNLGLALASMAGDIPDEAVRRTSRVRARNALLKSRELGFNHPYIDVMIDSIEPDGADLRRYSSNPGINALMHEGQVLFAARKMDEALTIYAKVLQIDPKLYEAAMFSGDAYLHNNDFAQAEAWYQKAIAIDPARETAYRYSATPLMRQGRFVEARDRYVEAYISEPYSRLAVGGLRTWAQQTQATVGHPDIAVPTKIALEPDGTFDAVVDAALLTADDGSSAWVAYGATRAAWRQVRFAETFPAEAAYRHSLAEEADALRAVIAVALRQQQGRPPGQMSVALAMLKRLDDENLLEPYVLLARANEGIARDFPAYLVQHRDRLRRYVLSYMIDAQAPR
jgi:tetratricopeptide (TPR) repeat protein